MSNSPATWRMQRYSSPVKMRHVPELHFHYDDSVDKGERIEQLLRDSPKPESP
jgi:ribosome-binding factor A